MDEFGIHFGALSPTIAEQLDEAGVGYDEDKIDHCNRDAYAISRLQVRGLLTESQAHGARKKVLKKIEAAITPVEESA